MINHPQQSPQSEDFLDSLLNIVASANGHARKKLEDVREEITSEQAQNDLQALKDIKNAYEASKKNLLKESGGVSDENNNSGVSPARPEDDLAALKRHRANPVSSNSLKNIPTFSDFFSKSENAVFDVIVQAKKSKDDDLRSDIPSSVSHPQEEGEVSVAKVSPSSIELQRIQANVAFPALIMEEMLSLFVAYNEKLHSPLVLPESEKTWMGMNTLSLNLEKAMGLLLENSSGFIEMSSRLKNFSHRVSQESQEWGVHAQAWYSWSYRIKSTVDATLSWLPESGVSPLGVPHDFPKAKLSGALSPPLSIPSHLTENLIQCFTFFDFSKTKDHLAWTDTSHKEKFNEFWGDLLEYEPESSSPESLKAAQWKEAAMDAYASLSGRFVILQTVPPIHENKAILGVPVK